MWKSNLSYFTYRGRSIYVSGAYATSIFHSREYKKGWYGGPLLTYNKPKHLGRMGTVDISDTLLDGKPLNSWITSVQALFLGEEGIHIPTSLMSNYQESLITSYLLNSCLCIAGVKKKNVFEFHLVTKNPKILLEYRSLMALPVQKKGFDRFLDACTNSYEELSSGTFNTVRLTFDKDGINLKKHCLSSRNGTYLLPYYAANNFASKIVGNLSKQTVKLEFSEYGVLRKLVTTLNTDIVGKWMGATSSEAMATIEDDWLNPLSLGYLSIPDLYRPGQFVSVPLLHIKSIKPYA